MTNEYLSYLVTDPFNSKQTYSLRWLTSQNGTHRALGKLGWVAENDLKQSPGTDITVLLRHRIFAVFPNSLWKVTWVKDGSAISSG